jgi:symplekin
MFGYDENLTVGGLTRANASAALKRFASSHATISPLVIDFARTTFRSLVGFVPQKDDNGEVVEGQQDIVTSKLELYVVLSTSKPELLNEVFAVTKDLDSWVFAVLNAIITPLFTQIPVDDLLDFISNFPIGSEPLVLSMISTLLKNDEIKQDVIEKTRITFIEKDLDVRFLNLIITSLDRDNVLKHLPKVVESLDGGEESSGNVKTIIRALTEIKPALGDEPPESIVTAPELLIKIHNLEGLCSLKCILEGIS